MTLRAVALRLGGLFGITRLLTGAILAGALREDAFLATFFLATFFFVTFFLATFFLLEAFFLLTFFLAATFFLETFLVLARFFAAGFFLLTLRFLLVFFAACIFRLTFFFVDFLVDFLLAGFFRATAFFFGDFFAEAFFLVTLDFLAVVFFLPTTFFLAAFFREAFAGLRFLLAGFFAGIFLLLPVREKRGIIHWLPAHGSSKSRLFSRESPGADYQPESNPRMPPQTTVDQRLRLFLRGMSFTCDNRFMSPITLHYPEFSRAWPNTIKCD
jgi:hypothetical protein